MRLRGAALLMAMLACGDGVEPTRREEGAASRPARIILVSMDTVRADRVSGYGATDTTPTLREIAAEGVLFRRFYAAASYTLPATMSIFTGLDPEEHGVASDVARLSPRVKTLAEILSDAGYRTQAFQEGGFVDARFGFARGFDEYRRLGQGKLVEESLWGILEWMRQARAEPYFLFLHTYAAHFPYGGFERYRRESPERGLPSDAEIEALRERYPPSPGRRDVTRILAEVPDATRRLCTLFNHLAETKKDWLECGNVRFAEGFVRSEHFASDRAALLASYDARIRRIDRALGQIRATLRDLGQWQDTLLVVTSDHGEAFFEHGLQQHDYGPFEEALRVPFVVSWPRRLRAAGGRVVEGIAWHPDVLPTLLGLAGMAAPTGVSGRDLSDLIVGDQAPPGERSVHPLVLRNPHWPQLPWRRVALRGAHKYIEGATEFGDPEGFLYDLKSLPPEGENLREAEPELFEGFAARVADYVDGLERIPPVHQGSGRTLGRAAEAENAHSLSDQEIETLRGLGYLR